MMKNKLCTGIIGISLFFSFPAFSTNPEEKEKETQPSAFHIQNKHYVVVGTFKDINKAIEYTDQIHELGIWSRFTWNPEKNHIYVYTTATSDYQEAKNQVLKLKKYSCFKDSWVLSYNADLNEQSSEVEPEVKKEETKIQEEIESPEAISPSNKTAETSTKPKPTTKKLTKAPKENSAKKENTLNLVFDAFHSQDLSPVNAKIKVVDLKLQRIVTVADAHTKIELNKKRFAGDSVLVIFDEVGYRKMQHVLNLNDLVNKTNQHYAIKRGDSAIINFELVRPMPGDIITMYNVFFHSNSSVMRPSSRFELNQLLDMLKENPNYKIKIHGHTNGGGFGKIIKPKEGDTDFFRLGSGNIKTAGSAKKLSGERAETIRQYLISEGIPADQIETIGWGGKKNLYDTKGPDARRNMRVEIEIL